MTDVQMLVGHRPGTKGCQPTGQPLSPTAVRTYAWVYTWPLDDSAPPTPNLSPPIACPNATICGPAHGEALLEAPELAPPEQFLPRQHGGGGW